MHDVDDLQDIDNIGLDRITGYYYYYIVESEST